MAKNETFGQRLRRLIKDRKLSQQEVADQLNIPRNTVWRWINNQATPESNNLHKLATLLHVTTDELLNGAPEQGGWVLQIKIATEIKEEIIDMRANRVPAISNLTCTPSGGGFTLYGDYELWTDKKKVKALIKQLLAGRDLILANGKALGGIKS